MESKRITLIIGIIIFVIGFYLIISQTSWLIGLGIFMVICGNNIDLNMKGKK